MLTESCQTTINSSVAESADQERVFSCTTTDRAVADDDQHRKQSQHQLQDWPSPVKVCVLEELNRVITGVGGDHTSSRNQHHPRRPQHQHLHQL